METHITLYGDDSEWFEQQRQKVAEQRDGNEPGNAELVRLLMQESDI